MCLVNFELNCEKVRLIDEENNSNIVSLDEAKQIAEDSGLDLVLVSDKDEMPVCKLLNFEKFLYEQKKKEKEIQKANKLKTGELKEIRFSHGIAENDIRIKSRNISKLLQKNNKVKIVLLSYGRYAASMEKEYNRIINVITDELKEIKYDMIAAKKEEDKMTTILTPKK